MIKASSSSTFTYACKKKFFQVTHKCTCYIVFNSCPVYEIIQNATVVLKFTKDEKKIFFVKKKMHDDKKKLLVSDNLLFFEIYFFLHRHVFTFFANQQLKNIHSQLMSTNKDISYTWINSQTNATSGYTNGQLDIIMANFKNNPVLSQFYS